MFLFIRLLRLTTALLFIALSLMACSSHSVSRHSNIILSSKKNLSTDVVVQRIALLVPLQGPLASIGQSVKQGFLAAATGAATTAGFATTTVPAAAGAAGAAAVGNG